MQIRYSQQMTVWRHYACLAVVMIAMPLVLHRASAQDQVIAPKTDLSALESEVDTYVRDVTQRADAFEQSEAGREFFLLRNQLLDLAERLTEQATEARQAEIEQVRAALAAKLNDVPELRRVGTLATVPPKLQERTDRIKQQLSKRIDLIQTIDGFGGDLSKLRDIHAQLVARVDRLTQVAEGQKDPEIKQNNQRLLVKVRADLDAVAREINRRTAKRAQALDRIGKLTAQEVDETDLETMRALTKEQRTRFNQVSRKLEDAQQRVRTLTSIKTQPTASHVRGPVDVESVDGISKPVAAGYTITLGDRIETGKKALARFTLLGGWAVELGENSTLEAIFGQERAVKIVKGTGRFSANLKRLAARRLSVKTPCASPAPRGTDFILEVSKNSTRITVGQGHVEVTLNDGTVITVDPQHQASFGPDGMTSEPQALKPEAYFQQTIRMFPDLPPVANP